MLKGREIVREGKCLVGICPGEMSGSLCISAVQQTHAIHASTALMMTVSVSCPQRSPEQDVSFLHFCRDVTALGDTPATLVHRPLDHGWFLHSHIHSLLKHQSSLFAGLAELSQQVSSTFSVMNNCCVVCRKVRFDHPVDLYSEAVTVIERPVIFCFDGLHSPGSGRLK